MEHSNDNTLTLARAREIIAEYEQLEKQRAFEEEREQKIKLSRWTAPGLAFISILALFSMVNDGNASLTRGFFWFFLIISVAHLTKLAWRK